MYLRGTNLFTYTGGLVIVLFVLLSAVAGWSQDEEVDYMDTYTGADADLVGSTMCMACHQDACPDDEEAVTHISIFDADEENEHYGYGCEACHGPGGNHNGVATGILSFTKMPLEEVTGRCTMCHEELDDFNLEDWEDGRHNSASIGCVTCHSGHSANDDFLVEESDVAMCATCHADIAEAFENEEHGIPGSDMTCSDCHNPHD